LRRDSAPDGISPPNVTGVIPALVLPAITTSASPARMSWQARSSASLPLAGVHGAVHAQVDHDLAGGHVRQGRGHEVRTQRLPVDKLTGGRLDRVETGDRHVDHDACIIPVADGEPGVPDGLARGGDRELGEPGGSSQPPAVQDGRRIEPADLGCDTHGQIARVECGDRPGAGVAGDQVPPGGLPVVT
jgi:hypothetical protein